MSASQIREAAIIRRRVVLIENAFYKRFRTELKRFVDAQDVGSHQQALEAILLDLYRVAGESSFRYLQDKFGKARKDMSQALTQLLMNWATNAFELSTTIAETSKDMIRQATAQMVADGIPEGEMAKLIQEFGDNMANWRARTIARTESHAAVMESQYEIVQEMDLPEYLNEWASGSDSRTRQSHLDADGQQRRPNETFRVGNSDLRFPGDRNGEPEEVVNCRCVLLQVFPE
jgi:hypothetical protein